MCKLYNKCYKIYNNNRFKCIIYIIISSSIIVLFSLILADIIYNNIIDKLEIYNINCDKNYSTNYEFYIKSSTIDNVYVELNEYIDIYNDYCYKYNTEMIDNINISIYVLIVVVTISMIMSCIISIYYEKNNINHINHINHINNINPNQITYSPELNKKINKVIYKYISPKKLKINKNDICSICLENIINKEVIPNNIILLQCGHRFHKDCINEWHKIKTDCPECRNKNSFRLSEV